MSDLPKASSPHEVQVRKVYRGILRDLTTGVFDMYWIAVDSNVHRNGVGRRLLIAAEEAVRQAGARMLIAETSGSPDYEPTRKFYLGTGYILEATIRDFYSEGDDLAIFVKRF